MLDKLNHGDYADQSNTKFHLVEAPEPFAIELVSVGELKTGGGQEHFSLYFTGDRDKPLQQGVYRFSHEKLGDGTLFIVPISVDENVVNYEAVFNRMKKD